MRSFPNWCRDDAGTSAVEFAILAPLFMSMITGMLAYGLYFGASHSLQQLAADAARVSVAGINTTERNALVEAYLTSNADYYMLIDAEKLEREIGPLPSDSNYYQVTLSYDASNLPIWNLYLPLPLPGREISFTSTIRRGGV
jgi:Flp pilus assembly protein TadG